MKKTILFLAFSLLLVNLRIIAQENKAIHWMSFSEALEKNKKQPRKIIMDVYTDWCGWCKHMDRTTFADPGIAAYINANYYAVKFDAEGRDSIVYKGKTYENDGPSMRPGRKPTHPLAIEILGGQLSYPTLVYFDDSSNVIAPIGGYRSAVDIQPFLVYFAEDLYKYVNIQTFIDDFKKTYTDSLRSNVVNIKWLTMKEALEKNKQNPKKFLVFMQTDWCAPCKIQDDIHFNDSALAKYINENMYAVKLNATTKDSIVFNNYTYINENKGHPFHQLAVTLLNGKMKFPNMVFITEKLEIITAVPGYFELKTLEPLVKYFNTDVFKTKKWEDYLREYSVKK